MASRISDGRPANGAMGAVRDYLKIQAIPLSVLALMIVVASIMSPAFFSGLNSVNMMVQQTTIMVVSMGMFAVILSGGIDLSVGSQVAVAGVFCASFANSMPLALAVPLTVGICLVIGLVNGLIVAKLRIAPFIVTLGMQSFASGIAFWYCKSSPISWKASASADFLSTIGSGRLLGIPYQAIIWLVMVIFTAILIKTTVMGRILYAIGGNEEAVTLSGLNVKKWKVTPYVFSSFCCAIAGILLMARLGLGSPQSGTALETDCIAAVVIGGTSFSGGKGTVSGAVIGVFILGIINNILDLLNVSSYPQLMLKGAIIVVAVILSTIREKNA